MSDSQENIEAKLSAFIEGDLDEAGRAEIERHLEANPSHRKLLEELRQTRDFVRALPRAKAPADMSETLQGQLERSALLDGAGVSDPAMDLRPSRWPQVISIAAVLLLAVGLGTVVYLALPHGGAPATYSRSDGMAGGPGERPFPATSTRPTTTVSTITAGELAARTEAAADAARRAEVLGPTTFPATPAVAAAETPTTVSPTEATPSIIGPDAVAAATDGASASVAPTMAPTMSPAPGAGARPDGATFSVGSAAGTITSPAAGATAARPTVDAPERALYVVLNTSDPAAANMRVASYLDNNRIAYENVLPNAALSVVPERVDAGTAANFNQFASRGGATDDEQKLKADDMRYQQLYAKGYAGQTLAERERQQTPSQQEGQQDVQKVEGWQAQSPADMKAAKEGVAKLVSPQPQAMGITQQFLARGLSRQQVEMLKSAVVGPAEEAQVIEPPPPQADALRMGDEVRVTVNELVGPGVERTNVARVSSDGTIAMPMVESVRAAGLTPPQLSDAVARRYRDASLIERPTVTVSRTAPATGPSTAPTTGPIAGPTNGPTIVPTTMSSGATTQPVASTMPVAADEPLDVVIVVQTVKPLPSPVVGPMSQPTTMPTTAASVMTSAFEFVPSTLPVVTTMPATTGPTTSPTTTPAVVQPTTEPVR